MSLSLSSSSSQQQQYYLSSSSSVPQFSVYDLVSGDIPYTTLDQADRALSYGTQLEKNGQARKASAAFHEAATLYQCYLVDPSFAHVTCCQTSEEATILLAYACLRLAFLNYDALGDPKAAVRLYKEATEIDPTPSAVSFDGMAAAMEATLAGRGLQQALELYHQALEIAPHRRKPRFHKAIAMERLLKIDPTKYAHYEQEADQILEQLRRDESRYACWVDSWGYVRWHTRKVPPLELNLYRGTRDMLELALTAALPLIQQGGIVAEFGVGGGRSIRMTQELLPLDTPIHGFDTFTGLPQAWGDEPAGTYSTGGMLPNLEGSVYFHKGLFRDTIPPFLLDNNNDDSSSFFLAYANVDCDLYSSTLDILEAFHGRIVVGTVFVFDEYFGHATWRQDEFRAWRECCKRFGWKYEYLGFSLSTHQAVVRVTEA